MYGTGSVWLSADIKKNKLLNSTFHPLDTEEINLFEVIAKGYLIFLCILYCIVFCITNMLEIQDAFIGSL